MYLTAVAFSQWSFRNNPPIHRNNTMPEQLKQSEVQQGQDPTVAKQWDDETSTEQKFDDFAAIADKLTVCMMCTRRDGIGVCSLTPSL